MLSREGNLDGVTELFPQLKEQVETVKEELTRFIESAG